VDGRADVFSLGCVAHECLTGKPTFRGHEPGVLLAKLMLEDPPHLSEVVPEVPRVVGDLIARMLAKNPERRPTAAQVLRTLAALGDLSDGAATATALAGDPAHRGRAAGELHRHGHRGSHHSGEAPSPGADRATPVWPRPHQPPTLAELEARLALRFTAKTFLLPGEKWS
jgi:serine/threonine protein kinase